MRKRKVICKRHSKLDLESARSRQDVKTGFSVKMVLKSGQILNQVQNDSFFSVFFEAFGVFYFYEKTS